MCMCIYIYWVILIVKIHSEILYILLFDDSCNIMFPGICFPISNMTQILYQYLSKRFYTYSAPVTVSYTVSVLGIRSPEWISNWNGAIKKSSDRSKTDDVLSLNGHQNTNSRRVDGPRRIISIPCIIPCWLLSVMADGGIVADWWPRSRSIAVYTAVQAT